LVGLDPDGTVRVRLGRACMGCPGVGLTASMVIETVLKKAVPQITRVVAEATAASATG
jgi:Fe-S cluster biogenesis protein NfuA